MPGKYHKLSGDVYTKPIALYNILTFGIVFGVLGVLSLILPKPVEAVEEKRELVLPEYTVQTITTGKAATETTSYYSDTFPFRNVLIAMATQLEEMRGFRFDDVTIHNPTPSPSSVTPPPPPPSSVAPPPPATSGSSSQEMSSSSEMPSSQPPEEEENAVGEQQGSTFIYKGRAMGLFGYLPSMGQWYAQVVNSYADLLEGKVKVYNMVVPTSIDFYIPQKYKHLTQPQKESIDNIYNSLNDKVTTVDAYSQLEKHKDEYIYFNTDHHWTGLGAYYAYTAFAEQAGFAPIPIADFETRRLEPFWGTLYAQTKDVKLKENPDYVDYFMIKSEEKTYRYVKNQPFTPLPSTIHGEYAVSPNSYSVYLHGDFPLTRIDTNVKNGKKIAVVKESYGNAFAPFLANHYEQVFIVDERYFQLGFIDFIEKNGINELVFVNNVAAANTGYHIQNLEKIKYQQFYYPVPAPPVAPSSSEEAAPPEESSTPTDRPELELESSSQPESEPEPEPEPEYEEEEE